ncbi:MAG: T9SS type A sorting domain-containing protein [Bacteroidia bacterium]|nr:T9SS type A sorting domain-containing protein [Bacteroidia bacterium]
MKIGLLLYFLGVCLFLSAQNDNKRDHIWVLGEQNFTSIMDFNNIQVRLDSVDNPYFNLFHSNASISDTNGNLLMYSNGRFINNYYHQIIANDLNTGIWQSDPIYGNWQPMLILPFPDKINQYLVIYCAVLQPFQPVAYYYTVVDMNLNNGQGGVTDKNHEILNGSFMHGCLKACRHANGRDWWILIHEFNSNRFIKLLVSPSGIMVRGEQEIGVLETVEGIWGSDFTPDGSKYVYFSNQGQTICVFDFNRCDGILSNLRLFPITNFEFNLGISISSNSQFLYVPNSLEVLQFDLLSQNIESSKEVVAIYDGFVYPPNCSNCKIGFNSPQLAPDNKIYLTGGGKYLHTINNPNLKGSLCNIELHNIELRNVGRTPPNFPNFRLGALSGSGCDTLTSVGEPIKDIGYASIYPNPARSDAAISWRLPSGVSAATLQITGSLGQMVCTEILPAPKGKISLPLAHLPKGMYFYRIFHSEGQLYSGKLWKE